MTLLSAFPAAGQTNKDQATATARQAQSAFSIRDYPRAAALFRKAWHVHPDPRFLFNEAQCHHRTGDAVRTANTLEWFLAVWRETKYRRDAEKLLSKALARIARSHARADLRSVPAHASLTLNGRSLGPVVWLKPGSYTVRLTAQDYQPLTRRIRVFAGERRRFEFTMRRPANARAVATQPRRAMVQVAVPPMVAPPSPNAVNERRVSAGTWTSIGLTVAFGISAGIAYGVTFDRAAEARDFQGSASEYDTLVQRAEDAYLAGHILAGAAGAAAITAIVLGSIDATRDVAPNVGIGPDRITLGWRF